MAICNGPDGSGVPKCDPPGGGQIPPCRRRTCQFHSECIWQLQLFAPSVVFFLCHFIRQDHPREGGHAEIEHRQSRQRTPQPNWKVPRAFVPHKLCRTGENLERIWSCRVLPNHLHKKREQEDEPQNSSPFPEKTGQSLTNYRQLHWDGLL